MIPLTPLTLLIFQLFAHCALIYWLSNIPNVQEIFAVAIMYFITGCIGMSITYHRLLTHRSFKTWKLFEYIGTICATIGLTGSSLSWTATHRRHHAKSDRNGDPHSPWIIGPIRAQFLSMFSLIYIKNSPVIRSKFHQWIHRNYFNINLFYALVLWYIGGINYIIILWLVPAAILWNAGSCINTVCHCNFLGYRSYNTPDKSTNNPILGYLMWGEGWHNNHHRFQSSPRLGFRWWEIDIGWTIIKLIKK